MASSSCAEARFSCSAFAARCSVGERSGLRSFGDSLIVVNGDEFSSTRILSPIFRFVGFHFLNFRSVQVNRLCGRHGNILLKRKL